MPGNSLRVSWTRGTVLRSGAALRELSYSGNNRFIGVWQHESGKGPRLADGAAYCVTRANLSTGDFAAVLYIPVILYPEQRQNTNHAVGDPFAHSLIFTLIFTKPMD